MEYVSDDERRLKGSIGIVRGRSALMVTVDWISQSRDVHPNYDIRRSNARYSYPGKYTFEDKHFSRITNVKEQVAYV